jgi:formylglycine-generating enzyme required for sulfatase activity
MKTINLFAMLVALASVACSDPALGDTFGSGANTFNIEFVAIGNPNNSADTSGDPNPAGSVPYAYRISKYEISEQMFAKANAEGALGIIFSTRGPDKPVTHVGWNEAARFVNWLNESTHSMPAYKFAFQPGDAGYDPNDNIELWLPSDPGYDPNNLYRNSKARYFLPNIDEWYKAAYYDPNGGAYYDYPTGSNSPPTPVASGAAAGSAVYNQTQPTGPADITLAGGLSPYGTMGQGGNVYEWQETDFDYVNGPSSSTRVIRGGYWHQTSGIMTSSQRSAGIPSHTGVDTIGIRVASIAIPEPNTVALLVFGFILPWGRFRRVVH